MKNYTLIITEKPSAAKRIAESLDLRCKPQKFEEDKIPYYFADRDKKIVIKVGESQSTMASYEE